MYKFNKDNLRTIVYGGLYSPMTEFFILKDLHTGEYVLDNYIVEGTHYIGYMDFLISDVIDAGLDTFADHILDTIPRNLMTYSEIKSVCGTKIVNGLYSPDKKNPYKPINVSSNDKKTSVLYFDKDVVLEYCSEHQKDLTQTGKKFFESRKDSYRYDKCVLFDKDKLMSVIHDPNEKKVSENGVLTIQFE